MKLRLLAVLAALSLGGCYGLAGDDEMSRYLQRSDTMTMSAGDAKQVNAVTHTINPWPRHVQDRRIATDARRMNGAVQRYSNSNMPQEPLPTITDAGRPMGTVPGPTTNQNINISGAGAGGAGVLVGGAGGR
jgi:hypothetical protein